MKTKSGETERFYHTNNGVHMANNGHVIANNIWPYCYSHVLHTTKIRNPPYFEHHTHHADRRSHDAALIPATN